MIKTATPKPLWDHCIKLEGQIRSHTALDIYHMEAQVPETIMSGQTGDISNLYKFKWFQWVMYYQPIAKYPEDRMFLGRWLGPAIDVGSVMTYKILLPSGNFVSRSTVRPLTPMKEANPVVAAQKLEFTAALHGNLGKPVQECDFELTDLMPLTVYHEANVNDNGLQGTPDEIEEIPLPTPEVADNYVRVKIQLPRGTSDAQGRVTKRPCDNDNNIVGRAHK